MKYFLDTAGTIPDGLGWEHFDPIHIAWLSVLVISAVVCSVLYRKSSAEKRKIWRWVLASLIVLNEIFKMVCLTIGGRYTVNYLPLHLCSINIFVIAIHAIKPSKLLDNLLYTVCIPGAIAALLFPTWTELPVMNFSHLHSFTIHILLALYPIVLTAGGDIKPSAKELPKSLLLLLGMAGAVCVVNLLLDTNYFFLMEAEKGNPLYLFEQAFGSHLIGFPVIIAGVLFVMYTLPWLFKKIFKKA